MRKRIDWVAKRAKCIPIEEKYTIRVDKEGDIKLRSFISENKLMAAHISNKCKQSKKIRKIRIKFDK